MFGQAKGANTQLLFQRTGTFRQAPVSPAAISMPFSSYGLFRDPKKIKSPSINASPLPAKSGLGDATVEGPIKSVLCLRAVGYWLSCLLGVPTAHKAVTKQPTNVTGVTVHYAQTAAPSGNGTLAYVNSAKTLAWTANGETAGTPVDVSAGGRFTLASGTANHGIVIEVIAASLPTTDKTDSDIAVSATLKCHVFPFNLNDRPVALLELGMTDIGKYRRVDTAFVSKLAYDILAQEQSMDISCIAGAETDETSVWDAAPTTFAEIRASGCGGLVSNGLTGGLGTITGGSLALDLSGQGKKVGNQTEGYGYVDWSEISLGGSMQAVFDGSNAWALARADGSTRLRIGSTAVYNSQTFGLWWDIPNAELNVKNTPVEGKSGLFAELEWLAHRDAAGRLPLVTLINDIASY